MPGQFRAMHHAWTHTASNKAQYKKKAKAWRENHDSVGPKIEKVVKHYHNEFGKIVRYSSSSLSKTNTYT